jgi:hypothetical protein
MPGINVPTRGTTGVASNTVWFAALPDRLNMLLPMSDIITYASFLAAADSVNKFFAVASSFFGVTTAPDGTTGSAGVVNTAQKLVEDSANAEHYGQAGYICNTGNQDVDVKYRVRASVFAKAAERTRIVVSIRDGKFDGTGSGIKQVFDLAGGTLGPAGGTFGTEASRWTFETPEIVSFGSGWYRCTISAAWLQARRAAQPNSVGTVMRVQLDNGSGVAAESSTYAGDGASGVYVWKANLLPTRCWGMQRVFFDDFDSAATIDITNSKAAGFNWYVNGGWPQYTHSTGWATGAPSVYNTDFSVASSLLTIVNDHSNVGAGINTTVSNHPTNNGYTGQAFVLPAYFESRIRYTQNAAAANPGLAFWTVGVETLTGNNLTAFPTPPSGIIGSNEYDFFEALPGFASGSRPRATFATASAGISSTFIVNFDNTIRPCGDGNFHIFGNLFLPDTSTDSGRTIVFYDGAYVESEAFNNQLFGSQGTLGSTEAFGLTGNKSHYPVLLGGGSALLPGDYDYVAVYSSRPSMNYTGAFPAGWQTP